jgi:hypothetical protein
VVLPYEKQAQNGDDMPAGLAYADQLLFQQLRLLYAQKRQGIIDRETAVREKRKFLDEYHANQVMDSLVKGWVQAIQLTELARAEFRKNPCIETATKLVDIIEGRVHNV